MASSKICLIKCLILLSSTVYSQDPTTEGNSVGEATTLNTNSTSSVGERTEDTEVNDINGNTIDVTSTTNAPTTTTTPPRPEDQLADKLLEALRQKVNQSHLEPLDLQDIAFLTEGKFTGLESIRRVGPAIRPTNGTLEMIAVIIKPKAAFNWTFSFLFSRLKGSATVKANDVSMKLRMRQTSDTSADLDMCDIPLISGISVDLTGVGRLNYITGRVAALTMGLMRSTLAKRLKDPLCSAIAQNI